MSSPIAKLRKTGLDRALVATHQQLSHSHRIDILARQFAERIRRLHALRADEPLRLLDVGCGDMTMADAVAARFELVDLRCADIHACPAELATRDRRWQRYVQFDGHSLPFAVRTFDVVMFCDVLHHVPESLRAGLLASAAKVGRVGLVKDHFEYGWASRQMLRAMDLLGNFGYGVTVPNRYFDPGSFDALCDEAGLNTIEVEVGIRLYDHLPLVRSFLSPRWHFLASCVARDARQGTSE
jgi:SAM-dependent methyltransferase